jgi:hypothetical protein
MLVQQVLSHRRLHEDVPPMLLTKIKSHFVVTDTIPTPPKLMVLNIDEIISPPPEGDMTAHIATPEMSPGVASLKSDYFPQVPEYDLQDCELDTILASTPDPVPSNSPKSKPTMNTLSDQPNMKPFHVPSPCEQGQKHITEQQAHRYLGFRTLRDFKILNSTGNGTATIINNGTTPLELGDVAILRRSRHNATPVPRPAAFLTAVHMDIGYGDCVAIGGS